jgi:hypoxanthine-DNA glycosylase
MSANSPTDPRKSSFAPFVAPDTRLLVLGTLPGEESLRTQRYYAHPRNLFWHLIGTAIGKDIVSLDYEDRVAALREAHVGLWDTIASARRTGSLDTAIREVEHNPLAELVASLPELRAVAFNGATSTKIGTKLLAGSGVELVPLPSSSPAHAAMRLADKEALWRELGKFLR